MMKLMRAAGQRVVQPLTLVVLLALAGCGPGDPPRAPGPELRNTQEDAVTSFELVVATRWAGPILLARGASGLEALVIRDDAAYDALLARLPAQRIQMKQPAPPSDDPLRSRPAIDFTTQMLVVLVRSDTIGAPVIARVSSVAGRLVVRYAAPPPPPEARPVDVGGYAAVLVARTDGEVDLVGPRLVTQERELAAAVGELVTLRGTMTRTRIPTILGVDVDEGSAEGDQAAEATGWLEREEVTQAEIDARVAASGQYAHRGAGTFYRLVDPEGGGLADAQRVW